MCGRFTLTVNPDQLQETFPWAAMPEAAAARMQPRFNIAPTQPVAVIPNTGESGPSGRPAYRLDFFQWGLVPSWAKDPAMGSKLINARAETLAEKPSFRSAFRRRRCLVLADGFYEWRQEAGSKTKTPMYVRMHSGKPFAFAGLWEVWNSPDGSTLLSCAIITTSPNQLMEGIHNRMPVILPDEAYPLWLQPGELDPAELQPLLKPFPDGELTAFPVARLVNSPQNDLPDCILPLA